MLEPTVWTDELASRAFTLAEGEFNPTSTPPNRFRPITAAPVASLLDTPIDRWPSQVAIREVVTAPSYSRASFEPERLDRAAHWAVRKASELRAEAIVAIGHSGLVIAGAVSVLSGLPVFAVRKRGEQSFSHDPSEVNGVARNGPVERWVFLDDFIASGKSFRWSAYQVHKHGLAKTAIPVASLSYSGTGTKMIVAPWWNDEIGWDGWSAAVGTEIPGFGLNDEE
jgi:Adenine/guanine phosphoribosyltransferases and related PRPP-binding proteins